MAFEKWVGLHIFKQQQQTKEGTILLLLESSCQQDHSVIEPDERVKTLTLYAASRLSLYC